MSAGTGADQIDTLTQGRYRRWQQPEIDYLREHREAGETFDAIGAHLNRPPHLVQSKAGSLGIKIIRRGATQAAVQAAPGTLPIVRPGDVAVSEPPSAPAAARPMTLQALSDAVSMLLARVERLEITQAGAQEPGPWVAAAPTHAPEPLPEPEEALPPPPPPPPAPAPDPALLAELAEARSQLASARHLIADQDGTLAGLRDEIKRLAAARAGADTAQTARMQGTLDAARAENASLQARVRELGRAAATPEIETAEPGTIIPRLQVIVAVLRRAVGRRRAIAYLKLAGDMHLDRVMDRVAAAGQRLADPELAGPADDEREGEGT